MEQRGGKKKVVLAVLSIVFIIAVLNTVFFLIIHNKTAVTGKISFSPGIIKDNYGKLGNTSKLLIAVEWLAVIFVILFILIIGAMKLMSEREHHKDLLEGEIKIVKSRSETDLDMLYKILKEKKVLRLDSVAQYFKVDSNTALEWFKILEETGLAELSYPIVGDPKLILIEKEDKK